MPPKFMNDPALKEQSLGDLLAYLKGDDVLKREQMLKGLDHIFYLTKLYTNTKLGIDNNPLNKPEESTREYYVQYGGVLKEEHDCNPEIWIPFVPVLCSIIKELCPKVVDVKTKDRCCNPLDILLEIVKRQHRLDERFELDYDFIKKMAIENEFDSLRARAMEIVMFYPNELLDKASKKSILVKGLFVEDLFVVNRALRLLKGWGPFCPETRTRIEAIKHKTTPKPKALNPKQGSLILKLYNGQEVEKTNENQSMVENFILGCIQQCSYENTLKKNAYQLSSELLAT